MATSYTSLEPDFEKALYGQQAPTFDATKQVSTFLTFNFMYVAAITTIIAAAAIMYMIAGGWRIEASERGIRKSDETFKRVTIGLIGVLSLFTILYTLNRDLLRGDVGLQDLKSSVVGGATGITQPTPPTTGGQGGASEQANRATLLAAGIAVNKAPCTPDQMQQSAPSCTNLADMPQSVISMLVQLKTSCPGSSMTVTGGTEPGHVSHGPGKPAVDINIGDKTLNSCVRKFPTGPALGFCNSTYSGLGFTFCDERIRLTGTSIGAAHWHVFQ